MNEEDKRLPGAYNPHARMKDLDAQFDDEEITFETWKAFIILNYPSLYNDKNVMIMLGELYDTLYLEDKTQ